MKIRLLVLALSILLFSLSCAILVPPRKTTDARCNFILNAILETPGHFEYWKSLSNGERLSLIKRMTRREGTVGEYLNMCVDEGWLGYYTFAATPIPYNQENS